MRCLPVVHVGRPDTVQLSGRTSLKTSKAIHSWTVLGFDICPEDSVNITSPTFSHPNLSKWCVVLKNDSGKLKMCFRLVSSSDSLPVTATLKASLLSQDSSKTNVYAEDLCRVKINKRSPWQCLSDAAEAKELGEKWTFECEVCTVEILTEDTSGAPDRELYSAVAEDLERLLDSKDYADITLSAVGVRLEAHRSILCARSPVFRAMLSHNTKEAREGLIPGVEPEVLMKMLRYMYTDRVEVSGDMTEQLLVVCDKYELQDAKLQCERELARRLTVDNAANTAACAIFYSCSFLQKVCVEFIKQNLEQVLGSRSWADIIDKYPKVVKTITELVTKGPERCSSPPDSCGSKSDVGIVNSPDADSVSESITPETCAGNVDTVWDSSLTCCERKKMIYLWDIVGSPSDSCGSQSDVSIVSSPGADLESESITPETCAGSVDTVWNSSYTCCERKKVIYFWDIVGVKNWPEDGEFVASPSFWHPETLQWELRLYKCEKKYHLHLQLLEKKIGGSVRADVRFNHKTIVEYKGLTFEKGSLSSKYVFWNEENVSDTLSIKCEISIMCVLQQCGTAIKPVLQSVLREDLNSLLESGNFTDFKLCAGTVEMGVHRAILAARSPFFARILQPGSEESKAGQLELPDVKPEVLAEILLYIYTGKVKNLDDSTAELLSAAHKFELCHLKRECVTHLSGKLAVGNAVSTAVCAIDNQSDVLLNASLGFIRLYVKQVMGTAEWIEAFDRHPAALKRISQLVGEPDK